MNGRLIRNLGNALGYFGILRASGEQNTEITPTGFINCKLNDHEI